jgi:hypothetical protein
MQTCTSFESFRARVAATAFFGDDPTAAVRRRQYKLPPLTGIKCSLLADLLEGYATLSGAYVLYSQKHGWSVCDTVGGEWLVDGEMCTCGGTRCDHVCAVERALCTSTT